jgi:AcrR family transcriptional regulator
VTAASEPLPARGRRARARGKPAGADSASRSAATRDAAGRESAHQARAGRRTGPSRTREAILAAARARFGVAGYDRATIRSVAASAGVDPALVYHFYGSKEKLFAAAMRMPVVPGEEIAGIIAEAARHPGASPGERLVRGALAFWERAEVRQMLTGLLRSALVSEPAAVMLREFVTATILPVVAGAATTGGTAAPAGPAASASAGPPPEAIRRAALAGSQMVGLALARYVIRLEPLATLDPDDLARMVGPAIDRYLSGDLGAPAQPAGGEAGPCGR